MGSQTGAGWCSAGHCRSRPAHRHRHHSTLLFLKGLGKGQGNQKQLLGKLGSQGEIAVVSTRQGSGGARYLRASATTAAVLDASLPRLPDRSSPPRLKVRQRGERRPANHNSPGQIYLLGFCYRSVKWKDPEAWRPGSRRNHTQERSSGWQSHRSLPPQLPSARHASSPRPSREGLRAQRRKVLSRSASPGRP